ncbi:MAG: outer membrane beta-barrel protein, partial [Nitrospiria bacterium]
MMKWIRIMVMAVVSFLFLGSQGFSFAAEKEKKEKKWFENVSVSGFVDAYYGYNFNQPGNGPGGRFNQLRNFDLYNDQFALSMAELVFQKNPEPFGFRVDLDYGATADFVACGNVNCAA